MFIFNQTLTVAGTIVSADPNKPSFSIEARSGDTFEAVLGRETYYQAHDKIGAKFVVCNNSSYRILKQNIVAYWRERGPRAPTELSRRFPAALRHPRACVSTSWPLAQCDWACRRCRVSPAIRRSSRRLITALLRPRRPVPARPRSWRTKCHGRQRRRMRQRRRRPRRTVPNARAREDVIIDTPIAGAGALARQEIAAFAAEWYRKLDEHVPAGRDPAAALRPAIWQFRRARGGVARASQAFRDWYAGRRRPCPA